MQHYSTLRIRTAMPAFLESFWHAFSTSGTVLRGKSGIDVHDFSTGAFSLVGEYGSEHRPGSIGNAFVQTRLCTRSVGQVLSRVVGIRLRFRSSHHVLDVE